MEPEHYSGDERRSSNRYARLRTIIISVVCSGLVSLFIGNAIERQSYNSQADRSRTNCHLTQNVADLLGKISDEVSESTTKKDISNRWAEYSVLFRSAVPPAAKTCEQIFPKRGALPFIED